MMCPDEWSVGNEAGMLAHTSARGLPALLAVSGRYLPSVAASEMMGGVTREEVV